MRLAVLGLIVLQAMSHTPKNVTDGEQELLRDIMSARPKPRRPTRTSTARNQSIPLAEEINRGHVVFDYLKMVIGEDAMSNIVKGSQPLHMPRDFWPGCCLHCFNRTYSDALRKQLTKAVHKYIQSLRSGATTSCGMLGDKMPKQKRSKLSLIHI